MPVPAPLPSRSRCGPPGIDVRVAGDPVVRLLPTEGRVRVGLVMHPLDRVVDVSVQPAASCETLRDVGRRRSVTPSAVEASTREALAEARERCASWAPPEDASLLAGFGGAAFPLLAAAYDAGSAPVREVPRWAEPVVASRTARDGAVAVFGSRTTRPVVRALVESLKPGPSNEVDFANLALAMIGLDLLQPDCLARVLGAERVGHPSDHLPDPSTLQAARLTVATWGPVRAERVLLDAAANANGLKLLIDTVRYSRQLRGHGPAVLPNRLTDLHDVHRSRVATAPPPRPRPAPAQPACQPALPRREIRLAEPARPARPQHRIYAPPATPQLVEADAPLGLTPATQAIHGSTVGDLTFVLPRTAGDLKRWGRLLANCLGDFGPAVAAGRSTIIGIERAGALAFAVEIEAGGAIRQFAGHANRAPDAALRNATVHALVARGLVAPSGSRNAPWLAGVTTRP